MDMRQHFYLTKSDHNFLLRFRSANRFGVALQIGLIRLMGFLPDGWDQQISLEVLRFTAAQLELTTDIVPTAIQRPNTRGDHLSAILTHLTFRRWEPLDAVWLEPWLLERALEQDRERQLLTITCLKLQQEKILRPAINTLERLVGSLSELAYQETYRRLNALLTPDLCHRLDQLLTVGEVLTITRHRWLVQTATSNNPVAIRVALDKLKYLRE